MSNSSFEERHEISEWTTQELCRYFNDNNLRFISDICKTNSLTGADIFAITPTILKEELNIKQFTERQIIYREFQFLIYEHCIYKYIIYINSFLVKANVIFSDTNEGVVITLDNDPNMKLSDLSSYIAGMFNIVSRLYYLYKILSRKKAIFYI
jgi:hypothetical protein